MIKTTIDTIIAVVVTPLDCQNWWIKYECSKFTTRRLLWKIPYFYCLTVWHRGKLFQKLPARWNTISRTSALQLWSDPCVERLKILRRLQEGHNGVNRQPSNGLKMNHQPSKLMVKRLKSTLPSANIKSKNAVKYKVSLDIPEYTYIPVLYYWFPLIWVIYGWN